MVAPMDVPAGHTGGHILGNAYQLARSRERLRILRESKITVSDGPSLRRERLRVLR